MTVNQSWKRNVWLIPVYLIAIAGFMVGIAATFSALGLGGDLPQGWAAVSLLVVSPILLVYSWLLGRFYADLRMNVLNNLPDVYLSGLNQSQSIQIAYRLSVEKGNHRFLALVGGRICKLHIDTNYTEEAINLLFKIGIREESVPYYRFERREVVAGIYGDLPHWHVELQPSKYDPSEPSSEVSSEDVSTHVADQPVGTVENLSKAGQSSEQILSPQSA